MPPLDDVVLCKGELVYLRDYTMRAAKVESEDGNVEWVPRSLIKAI